MSILSSKPSLVAGMASSAGVSLNPTDFQFTDPKPTEPGDSTTKNSKVMAIAAAEGTYRGSRVVFYDRLDLSAMENFEFIPVTLEPGVSVYDLLGSIYAMTGIAFTVNDLVDHQSVSGEGNAVEVLLEAKATSLGFTGSFTLTGVGYPNISTAFSSNILPGF